MVQGATPMVRPLPSLSGPEEVTTNRRIVTLEDIRKLRESFRFERPPDLREMLRTRGWHASHFLYNRYHHKSLNEYMYAGLLELFGKDCAVDGRSKDVQWAHLKPTELNGTGRSVTLRRRDIEKHPDCYIRLCRRCHRRFDRGLLIIDGIRSTTPPYLNMVRGRQNGLYDYQDQVTQQQGE